MTYPTTGFFGDSTDVRYYTQVPWLRYIMDFRRNGYRSGTGLELAVHQHSSGDMSVDISSGECWIQGNHYASDASANVVISAAHASLARIDRIVMRNTITSTRKIAPVCITGVPAISPVAPAYTRTADVYDIVLADVAVAAAATTILTANITDQRSNTTYCGIAAPLFVRITDSVPGDDLDLAGYGITGAADPTADTEGATLNYVLSKTISGGIPAGTPIIWTTGTCPDGYLEMNGQAITSAVYPLLYSIYGSTLPDWRGRCLVGYDPSQNEFDAVLEQGGEKLHILTAAEMPAHVHGNVLTAVVTNFEPIMSTPPVVLDYPANTITGSTGSGTGHQNCQPYIVQMFIVRAE
jgi:microcystin-dependent protein